MDQEPLSNFRVALLAPKSSQTSEIARPLKKRGYKIQNFFFQNATIPYSRIKIFSPHLLIWISPSQSFKELASLKNRDDIGGVPVLCVQSSKSANGLTACLDAGADDFIHDPFDPRILVARAENLIRRELRNGRMRNFSKAMIESGKIHVDLLAREARLKDKPLALTRFEFDLLAFLLKNEGEAVERKKILAEVWKYPEDVQTRTLDKHIETLRKKMGSEGARLATVHGLGYLIKPDRIVLPPVYPYARTTTSMSNGDEHKLSALKKDSARRQH